MTFTYLIEQKKERVSTVTKHQWYTIYSCNNGDDALRYLRNLAKDTRENVEYRLKCVKEV